MAGSNILNGHSIVKHETMGGSTGRPLLGREREREKTGGQEGWKAAVGDEISAIIS